jgi:DNA-binding transcriptional regulator YbjK
VSETTEQAGEGRTYGGVAASDRSARRRGDLMAAALDLIAEAGPSAVTKRACWAQ